MLRRRKCAEAGFFQSTSTWASQAPFRTASSHSCSHSKRSSPGTRIGRPEKQSYFVGYVEELALDIPVILVGGNRDVERLERIVQQDEADYIALCRPLIAEPDLPNRWFEGRGSPTTDCISCNSCMLPLVEGQIPYCVLKRDKEQYRVAQEKLTSWVQDHVAR